MFVLCPCCISKVAATGGGSTAIWGGNTAIWGATGVCPVDRQTDRQTDRQRQTDRDRGERRIDINYLTILQYRLNYMVLKAILNCSKTKFNQSYDRILQPRSFVHVVRPHQLNTKHRSRSENIRKVL